MCGIAGFIDNSKVSSRETLIDMTNELHHRGPDDSGYVLIITSDAHVGLGHRRLSILDLTPQAHQPMVYENITIAYNGEVYNFNEIKSELESLGYSFDSCSDTEVIIKSYHKWGIAALHKFNGMFAIAIYDSVTNKLILVRDRAGVKPLYWYQKDDLFIFSSELKSFSRHPHFHKEINYAGLSLFMKYGYILEPHCIFKYTRKLKAGHFLEFDIAKGFSNEQKYWDVIDAYNQPKIKISETEALKETERLLKSACQYRMVADVPVGVFLSGGYDSSLVAALIQTEMTDKLKTFTIGFSEQSYNEAPYAKSVSQYLGTDHTEYYCTHKEANEILPLLPEIYDEPFGDSSAIPTILVSRLARQDVTVALSADGGDETFGGYEKYTQILKYRGLIDKLPFNNTLSALMGMIGSNHIPILNKTHNFDVRYRKISQLLKVNDSVSSMQLTSQVFSDEEISDLFVSDYFDLTCSTSFDEYLLLNSGNDQIDQMLAIDYKTYQQDDILVKIDRASMSTSLESREPLLDYRIIEFISRLDSSFKINKDQKKYLLKTITHKYLPQEMMDRPKMGFSVPITDWFRDELKEYLLFYLDEERIKKEGIFNVELVVKLRDRYLMGGRVTIQKLWLLLMFQMWKEKWL